jgi:ABC-2 type transport system permease protein
MIKHNLKYEWTSLLRDRWILILLVLFFSITLFAVRNGREKVTDRSVAIEKERQKLTKVESLAKAEIDSVEQNLKPLPKESWADPRSLINVAWDAPRVVAMDAQPLTLISTGQSDLFTHYAKPKIYGESYTLGFSELSNPVQLLFGSFDLAFVCIYLLPLLVLAFSYNILSSEKESGVMKLTFSQPVSIFSWLLSKLLLRFVILSGIVTISILVSLSIYGVELVQNLGALSKVIVLVLLYTLFWFFLSFFVNLFGKSSGNNAVALVAIWLVIVLLIPSIISQATNTLYPVPSRVTMLHQYRVASAEANKRADEILKSYLREHPELAPKDTVQENRYAWILSYFASSDLVYQSVKPILDDYDNALAKQQAWVNNLRWLSPAILMQNSLNEIAGTSTAHYNAFRKQVVEFSYVWKDYFKPRMFANELMKAEEFEKMPKHSYLSSNVENHYTADFSGIVAFTILIAFASVVVYRKYSFGEMISQNQ